MKRRSYLLILLAAALVLCAAVTPALAYFTDRTRAVGSIPVTFGTKTVIDEDIDGLRKVVTIKNTGGDDPDNAEPVWVRARADAGAQYTLTVTCGAGWSAGDDGWYYYATPVEVGATTSPENQTGELVGLVVEDADWSIVLQTETTTPSGSGEGGGN